MRIALVSEFYYPHLGGVTEHVHNLALQLKQLGHDAIIITSRMTGHHDDASFVRRVGTSRVIYKNGSFARLTTGFGLGQRLERIFRDEHIDLVHVHGGLAPTFGLIAPAAAWRLNLPVVATFHSWFPRSIPARVFQRPLQRRLDRHAAVIAVSQPVVNALSRYFRADWEIIPNGVNLDYFHPNGRRPADPKIQAPKLLFLGRLDPRNGLDTVIAAMPSILARYPNAQLKVAGDGPLRGYYQHQARPLGPAVQFVGRVYDQRVDYYDGADIYLCPTTKASFGITLLEAMACGTPMIVSDIIGFRELVNGGAEAILAPKNDPDSWASATIALLEDPRRRVRMSHAGLNKAACYAWPRVTHRILEVYRRALGSPRS